MKKLILLCSMVLLAISCNPQRIVNSSANTIIEGNGIIKEEIREVGNYHSITVQMGYDIILTNEPQGKIRVVGEENINPIILTEVKNGVLEIGIKPKMGYFGKKKEHKIYVPIQQMNALVVKGVSNVKNEGVLEFSNLKVNIEGVSSVALAGKVTDLDVSINGNGILSAFDLIAENANIKVEGVGNVSISATQSFNGKLKGVGSIKVKGNPTKVSKTEDGIGKIKIL